MQSTGSLAKRIVRVGRPSLLRQLQPAFLRGFELLLFFLPPAAIFVRVETEGELAPTRAFVLLLLSAVVPAALYAWLRAMTRRGDPRRAARELDRLGGHAELLVTAAEVSDRQRASRFFVPLMARAETVLDAFRGRRPRPALRLPALRRDLVLLFLTVLVLIVPSLPSGWLGPTRRPGRAPGSAAEGSREVASRSDDEDETGEGEGRGSAPGLDGRIELRALSDRALYFLGEEIELILVLEAKGPITPTPLDVVVLVDGEIEMALPLPADFVAPAAAGETTTLRWPIRARLESVGRYHRGLTALDARVAPRGDDEPDHAARANQVIIQISENSERCEAKRPTPVAEKPKEQQQKQQEKKEDERDQEQRPNEDKEKGPPKPAPGQGEGDEPPEDLPSKDYVVEPLFSGDETTKRKVDVYDRELEDASPEAEKPAPADTPRRNYQRMAEAHMEKLGLGIRERRAVRRYLDAIAPSAREGGR